MVTVVTDITTLFIIEMKRIILTLLVLVITLLVIEDIMRITDTLLIERMGMDDFMVRQILIKKRH